MEHRAVFSANNCNQFCKKPSMYGKCVNAIWCFQSGTVKFTLFADKQRVNIQLTNCEVEFYPTRKKSQTRL